jgi:hypothetical protein
LESNTFCGTELLHAATTGMNKIRDDAGSSMQLKKQCIFISIIAVAIMLKPPGSRRIMEGYCVGKVEMKT